MKFLLIAVVLIIAASVEANERCSWGKAYWCHSTSNAEECQKTQFCQSNVWDSKEENVDAQCESCKKIANVIRQMLEDGGTEGKAKAALRKDVCSMQVYSSFSACEAFLSAYYDLMFDLLRKGLDTDAVCSWIKLCTSPKKDKLAQLGDDKCTFCEIAAKEVLDLINSSTTEETAKILMKRVCIYFGGFDLFCLNLIDKYWDEIYENVIKLSGGPTELCKMIQICPADRTTIADQSMPKTDLCAVCKMVAAYLKAFLDSNATKAEVKENLENFCKMLPGDVGKQCSSLADEYFEDIWAILKEGADSNEMCQVLGLCSSSSSVSYALKRFPSMPKADLCAVCKMVVANIKAFLDSNTTKAEVKENLETFCKMLPGDVGKQCSSLVDKYFEDIWTILKEGVDFNEVCQKLGLCPSSSSSSSSSVSYALKRFPSMPKADMCSTCKDVANFVKTGQAFNSTMDFVKELLVQYCTTLPGDEEAQCSSIADNNFIAIWYLLKSGETSDEVCTQIDLCDSSSVSDTLDGTGVVCQEGMCNSKLKNAKTDLRQKIGDEQCAVCKEVVDIVKGLLMSNKTETEVEDEVKKVCPYLVGFSKQCKEIINMNFPMIWKLITDGMDPEMICDVLKLCQASRTRRQVQTPEEVLAFVPSKVRGVFCFVCEMVMKELKGILGTNATEQDIKDGLEKVCSMFPPSTQNDCKEFVDNYGVDIIKLILTDISPEYVCSKMGLCSTKKQLVLSSVAGNFPALAECDLCKVVLAFAKKVIGTKSAQGSVEKVVEMVCDLMSSSIKSECQEFITKFAPELIELLDKGISSKFICMEIKLCTTSSLMKSSMMSRKY